jgi:hypothetical protein
VFAGQPIGINLRRIEKIAALLDKAVKHQECSLLVDLAAHIGCAETEQGRVEIAVRDQNLAHDGPPLE